MASFEQTSASSRPSEDIPKFPIKRMEPSIQKFVKVIEIDLERLHKHRLNIEKYSRLQDWTSLNKEQINTTRTVQQIVCNVKEIEKTRRQVQDTDLEKFDSKISAMKDAALASVKEFVAIENAYSSSEFEDANLNHPLLQSKENGDLNEEVISVGVQQLHVQPNQQETETLESWENLHQSLEELNSMIHHFSAEVHSQQEKIDNIEDNLESAHENINQGTRSLAQASKYKAGILPVAGAVLGTIVGGPIGLVAGAKIGLAIGTIGGVAGFTGGKYIKKRHDNITNIELSNLSERDSSCCNTMKTDHEESTTKSNSWWPSWK